MDNFKLTEWFFDAVPLPNQPPESMFLFGMCMFTYLLMFIVAMVTTVPLDFTRIFFNETVEAIKSWKRNR